MMLGYLGAGSCWVPLMSPKVGHLLAFDVDKPRGTEVEKESLDC